MMDCGLQEDDLLELLEVIDKRTNILALHLKGNRFKTKDKMCDVLKIPKNERKMQGSKRDVTLS